MDSGRVLLHNVPRGAHPWKGRDLSFAPSMQSWYVHVESYTECVMRAGMCAWNRALGA